LFVEDNMLDKLSLKENCSRLRRHIAQALTEREAEILTMRYGLDNRPPRTQREIAAICKISRSYVSRIEKRAVEKLRQCFDGNS
jgi:RNA polymerase sporulation-specific sigma factor